MSIVLYLARVKASIKKIMANDGLLEVVPEECFYTSVESAVDAAQQSMEKTV